jgi:hypothetical protein
VTVELTYTVQIVYAGDCYEARASTGAAVRLDGLPIEPRWSTIVLPVTREQAKELALSLYQQATLTIRIEKAP